MFFKLNNEQEMDLIPLPPIEEDPRDERTDSFREALINARITDEPYLAAMEAVDRDADDYLEKTRAVERALKDSLRAQLGFLKTREHEYVERPKSQITPGVAKSDPVPVAGDLFESDLPALPVPVRLEPNAKAERRVEVGDTVRVRYLTDEKRTIKITISNTQSDPSRGIVHHQTPVASALLGAEEGDEVEILVGSYIRPAVIENIA